MRLSVGPSTAAKGVTSFAAVLMFAAGLCFAGLAFGMGSFFDSWSIFAQDPFAGDPTAPAALDSPVDDTFSAFGWVAKALGLCGIPFALAAVYLLLHVWRFQIRLDGAILSRRGALLTRRTDVTTAGVNMAGFNYSQRVGHDHRAIYRVAALAVTDQRTGKTIKVPLRGQGLDLLPPYQLRGLADVLDRNRSADSQRARGIAAQLRELAADPIAF
ncbi:MAG TPA: hypothetical protein VFC19_40250 [Candidatus Limnocylindrales bacterium]|nr:hypothetical protein [Candidatus Limnocylindrales bacterium]